VAYCGRGPDIVDNVASIRSADHHMCSRRQAL